MAKKKKKDKRKRTIKLATLQLQKPILKDGVLIYQGNITLRDLATTIKVKDFEIIKHFFMKGEKLLVNGVMNNQQVVEFCNLYNIKVKITEPLSDEEIAKIMLTIDDSEDLVERSPIVSILGHVDHGKTTLLDTIRKTSIVEKEKGGITQHIGAYIVEGSTTNITFIDTPGHEAFIQMRRRGASATDISIIVVAADDGVKPQTIEAIKHAKEAKVAIIVAINKIDKPDINIEKIKYELVDHGLTPEEWGGDIPFVEISAKENKNIDILIETIEIISKVLDLKAAIDKMPSGIVIESHLDSHLGSIATLLVQNGTLKHGDIIVVGHIMGKVRQMVDENKKVKQVALPSEPIRISGLKDTPHVGDLFVGVHTEKEAKEFTEYKKALYISRKKGMFSKLITQSGNKKILNFILRADTQGSLEVTKNVIMKYKLKFQHINILSMHVGKITQTDLDLANSTKATIVAFHIGAVSKEIFSKIKMMKIKLIQEDVIYRIQEEVENIILETADEKILVEKIGKAEIKKVFSSSHIGKIAGCVLLNGKVTKNALCSLEKNNKVIENLEIISLKRYKDEVKEISGGKDFGLVLKGEQNYEPGDFITFYQKVKTRPTLKELLLSE